jgi:nucleoside-diphosphate-sugar epimerase
MRVLVTGATGMLGSHLVEFLVKKGVTVRALVRRSSDTTLLEKMPIEVLKADVFDPGDLAVAAEDADSVFHAAGYLTTGAAFGEGDWISYQRNNVDLTGLLAEAAARAGVRRFVFSSSVSVYGPSAQSPVAESAPLNPVSHYGRSKVLAERTLLEARSHGMAVTIVRPTITYGGRDRHFLPALLAVNGLHLLPLVDAGRHFFDVVHVEDVVNAMWTASHSQAAAGQIYNVASGKPMTMHAMFSEVRRLLGSGPQICSISSSTLGAIRPLAEA